MNLLNQTYLDQNLNCTAKSSTVFINCKGRRIYCDSLMELHLIIFNISVCFGQGCLVFNVVQICSIFVSVKVLCIVQRRF